MFKNIVIATLVLMLAACAKTPDWDYDKSVQFANYKTYAWSPEADLKNNGREYQVNDLMEKRIRSAIQNEMSKQGFTLTDPQSADLLVNYHASVDTKIESDSLHTTYGARWNYWGIGWQTQTTTREYEVGTLVLDMIDKASNQLVWRGAKEGRLRSNQSPDQRTESINKTISELLANFPPKAQH
ncbi:DUF4136 domain-containing protein [Pseudoalteromonas sp. L23]|uniref:DUF4136 domain-containing protein n=1 Tax=Pseudoalteromonas TaxID=53246 RepID=UPI001F2A9745|nr:MULTISPECIES: DUF4136 domain-containing protein [unclassified Pseudoalteromonas]MCF2826664.1 DUF4136 domain-containing protein [Pseudoalteromonas sp. OF5H-5]MCF2834395.1 DUF4136 domain-containing protein [Pseudoalteromonas sp. DL2-H6]MCF2926477.1 DUF4136 domain-containing protein [Pseudoalteromonas sp. DL2-H1]MCF7513276.1 DUF4136 domain-containing protein [Pseudoalteromonas sp. L7]MCF7525316.1 DUF4136 domain-containing protein [Pseudoalteromonas sp. L23]